ncbi:hypothetical protein [Blastococcus saxobsidens]|uniref:Uncharacterized protein n=1 Tax=Blastococcus saxobsidens TaxID=138336 RepID=A0A4Q7Y3Q2_9ACTN|nr:hypothetical protein [Blastococcus saxobsidens]RZU30613.1 hypothetical protein BKA19_0233 [Blastococcus saxobsidens]
MSNFKFDDRAIKKLTDQAKRQAADESNRLFAQLGRQYRGKPVSVIKPALKRAWERDGGKITDPELTEYAQAISDGTPIKFRVGR